MVKPILLDQQLCFSIYQAHKVFNHFYAKALEPFHLTYSQYIVLLVLWEQGSTSVKALGQKVGLDSGTLTPLLKRLEKDDWVSRKRSKVDERRLEVSLTAKAQDMKEQVYAHVGSCVEAIGLSEDSYLQIKNDVESLQNRLNEVSEDAKVF
ncbi:MarR family transcriptional regulator [Agrilactobacillus composti DSM 18527 = JCM 14202]|uniref:HTH-type transcriptional regulator SarZ n=1 Tax=Agrilactobacillus composti DSM 18527 = JCM 14202 TaxID=1423734 RepID=X0PI26_9LACO|nr:MarR family transcriptional regulator [Agrilactobacillus composti]KRM34157.1 MarR family transcriptional regulator [Agrilactobacillus composti DSM 18527 = JCM 14202]GAF41839.1 organic hydroperoxide resistance transcriptional regulator [Agrilactobacillus composti DSM 18527 = JCM 14202]